MPARVLMDLDVGRVDHLQRAGVFCPGDLGEQAREDSPSGPAKMESIDAVPFAKPLWQLVPDASRDKDPPDTIQSFPNVSGATALSLRAESC